MTKRQIIEKEKKLFNTMKKMRCMGNEKRFFFSFAVWTNMQKVREREKKKMGDLAISPEFMHTHITFKVNVIKRSKAIFFTFKNIKAIRIKIIKI